MFKHGDKIGIVCCSNGQKRTYTEKIKCLENTLIDIGLQPVFSDHIYEKESIFSGSAKERADALMKFYKDDRIKGIFDISGGDVANSILPYLDYDIIANSSKMFWGYSDLTTIINAIYQKTGKTSVLYQIRNLIYDHKEKQIADFYNTIMQNGTDLSQLKQIGAFDKVAGIILGTFTEMETEKCTPTIETLVKRIVGKDLPIVVTRDIGHGTDSKGIIIGQEIYLKE